MTLSTLVINIGIVAAIITLLVGFLLKKHKSWVMTFLQNFCGVLFIFSGWVKAIDPMGTAFKMEQYFAEFESTFTETWFSFLAPLFPLLSEYSIGFSVFMIVFEIVLGIMLLFGIKSKFTSWAFLILVAFFTVLTGFTFLTGYVPSGVNFFDFGDWSAYKKSNMKVTDCGCFGDFIKLEPRISFFKDIALLVPSIFFVWRYKDMHQLVNKKWDQLIIWGSVAAVLLYCMSNYVWDLPHTDFRPFKEGANVAQIKETEAEAMANVKVTDFVLMNIETKEEFTLPYNDYMSNYAQYPKEKFKVIDQLTTEPSIPETKISDFEITDFDGGDVTYKYLENEKYHFMLVSYKAKYTTTTSEMEVIDTVAVMDSIFNEEGALDSVVNKVVEVKSVQEVKDYHWKSGLLSDLAALTPFIKSALAEGHEVSYVIGGIDKGGSKDIVEETGLPIDVYTADDILLKTIVRSNPGIVLWKDGIILDKWHKSQLPTYEDVKAELIK